MLVCCCLSSVYSNDTIMYFQSFCLLAPIRLCAGLDIDCWVKERTEDNAKPNSSQTVHNTVIISTANYTLKQATGTLCLQSIRSLSGQSWLQLWMQQWSRSSGQLHIWQKDSASWIIRFVSTSYIRYSDFLFTGILEEGLSSRLSQKPWCGLYFYITEITGPMCYYWGCFNKHTHWGLQDKAQEPTPTGRTAIIRVGRHHNG